MHDSAVAEREPARAARARARAPGPSARPRRTGSCAERLAQRRGERVRALLRARLDDQVDVDLEVAGADRRLDAVPVAARLRERPRDRRLADAEEAQRRRAGGRARASTRCTRLGLERARPEPPQLAGRAGQDHDDAAVRPRGRGPAPSRRARATSAPSGTVACLRHARREVGVRPPQALGDRARDLLDLRARARRRRAAARPATSRDQLDRAVVVGRARGHPRRGRGRRRQRLRAARLELVGAVADDRDPRRLEPERERLAREERAVQVGALAADELAARDDDRRARPASPTASGRRAA